MPNGFRGVGCAWPLVTSEMALVELSMKRLFWQVSSCVFETAVKGVVGTVKLAV